MNIQTHVVVVTSNSGKVWVIGTDKKRGFTEAGAEKAMKKLENKLPATFTIWSAELEPISEVLAARR